MLLGLLAGTGVTLLSTGAALLVLRRRTRTLRLQLGAAQYEARHDRLTGLPDLRSALDHLTHEPVGMVGLLDLDHFKTVNDRYGHHVGDLLLITIAERLRTAMQGVGVAARLSGDEFALIWSQVPADPLRQAERIQHQIGTPVSLETHRLAPTASLGLALPGPHLQGPALLAAADHAMYEAKNSGHRTSPSTRPAGRTCLYPSRYPPAPADRRVGPDRRCTRSDIPAPPTQPARSRSRSPESSEGDAGR